MPAAQPVHLHDAGHDDDLGLRAAAAVQRLRTTTNEAQEDAGAALRTFVKRSAAHKAAVVAAGGIPLLVTLLREGRCTKWATKTLSCFASDPLYGPAMLDAGVLSPLVKSLQDTLKRPTKVLGKLHTSCPDHLCEALGHGDVIRELVAVISAGDVERASTAVKVFTWLAGSSNDDAVKCAVLVLTQVLEEGEPSMGLAAVKSLDALRRGGVPPCAIVEAGALPLLLTLQNEGTQEAGDAATSLLGQLGEVLSAIVR
jgi:hypothetical protein